MRIGFDGKRFFGNFTGLGNYSRYVVGLVINYFEEPAIILYTPKRSADVAIDGRVTVRTNSSLFGKTFWRSFGIVRDIRNDRPDIYHGLSSELPFGIRKTGAAAVVTVHDLIFLRFPEYYRSIDAAIYRIKTKYACAQACRIIAISERTRLDLIELLHVPPEKIDVVYQGCDPIFKALESEAGKERLRQKYSLPDQFLLNVGTIEERKNLGLIVEAMPALNNDQLHLVVVGKQKGYAKTVKQRILELRLQHRIHFLENVPFSDLPGIYQLATVFIYPSRYEGFGIPILEALASGTPVIAATGSCLEEAGGPGSLYTSPDDPVKLASLIDLVLSDPEKRVAMINEGTRHSVNFDDRTLAAALQTVYTKALTIGY